MAGLVASGGARGIGALGSDAELRQPLLLTASTPGLAPGLSAKNVRTLRTAKGTQVSYKGHPLYFFAFEQIAPSPTGGFAPTGNGNGVKVAGGRFRLVTP